MTSNEHWFDIAVKLKENKIAEPVLWMGDWHHYKKAKELFGDKVVKDFDFFKFKSHKIKDINYKSKKNKNHSRKRLIRIRIEEAVKIKINNEERCIIRIIYKIYKKEYNNNNTL